MGIGGVVVGVGDSLCWLNFIPGLRIPAGIRAVTEFSAAYRHCPTYATGNLHKEFCIQSIVQSMQLVISTTLYDHSSVQSKQAGNGGGASPPKAAGRGKCLGRR